jgi:hypothetical protein
MKRQSRISFLLGMGCVLMCAAMLVWQSPTYYFWQQERMVRRVLRANPIELRDAATALLTKRENSLGKIDPSAAEVPNAIRILKPTSIMVSSNQIGIDFGDAFNPFGIIVYRPGYTPPPHEKWGRPPLRWVDGLWLYDDGQLEQYGQPLRAANGG